jgi:hypothetical protein
MGNKDKGKRETKKKPQPKPKADPGRRHEDASQAIVRTIKEGSSS